MRRAEKKMKATLLAVLTLCGSAVSALTPAAPTASGLAPMAVPTDAVLKPLTSAAVLAIPMGAQQNEPAAKKAVGTIAELEELQRQTALAEARKRLKDLQMSPIVEGVGAPAAGPGSASTRNSEAALAQVPNAQPPAPLLQNAQPPGVAAPRTRVPAHARAKTPTPSPTKIPPAMTPTSAAGGLPAELDMSFAPPPEAKLVNLLRVGGRARADVLSDGRLTTIKEGDRLGVWTVASIESSGVTVEYRYTVLAPTKTVSPPPVSALRPSIAEALPEAYALASSLQSNVAVESVKTRKLLAATAAELAAATGQPSPVSSLVGTPASFPNMAPSMGVNDSTNVRPAVPLLPRPLLGAGPTGQQ